MISLPERLHTFLARICGCTAERRFFGQILSMAAATLLMLSATAQAQVAGRIFFLNSATGAYLVGGVDPSGFFHSAPAATYAPLAGTTNLVANNTAILAYNENNGDSQYVVIDGYGVALFHSQTFGSGFGYVLGSGGDFFFYNGDATSDGAGAVVSTLQGGYLDHQIWSAGLSPWSNIVQTDDYMLFYNYKTGEYDAATFSPVNRALLQNHLSVGTIATGYNVIAPVNDNVILYNSENGDFKVMSIYFVGGGSSGIDFPDGRDTGILSKFYGAILPTVGHVVFYSYGSGETLLGHLTQSGVLTTDQKLKLPLYTTVLTTGQYVVGYNAESGELDVYGVTTGGKLTKRSTGNIGTDYGFVTATQS